MELFAPEVELDRWSGIAERQDIISDDEDVQDDVPNSRFLKHGDGVVPQIEAPQMSVEFVRSLFRSLNETQAAIFYTVCQWCQKRVWGHNPEQFFYFVSGGAGCGKSTSSSAYTRRSDQDSATTASTTGGRGSVRAHGALECIYWNGSVQHFRQNAAFHFELPRNLKPPYQGLENALDELRATLRDVEILIIDEVSMISKDLFAYINWRFQQIKGSKKPFGESLSLLWVTSINCHLWVKPNHSACTKTMFGLLESTFPNDYSLRDHASERRLAFAQLFKPLTGEAEDRRSCRTRSRFVTPGREGPKDCPCDALHVFATNKEVHRHNTETIHALHADIITIDAEDYRKDPRTGGMKRQTSPSPEKRTTCLTP